MLMVLESEMMEFEVRVKAVVFNLFNLTDDADFKFLSKHI